MKRTLQTYLLSRVQNAPDQPAVAFINERGEDAWLSIAEFVDQASGYAAFLAECGLKKGGVCVVVLPSGEVAATVVAACLLMGAAPLLIAPPSLQTAGAHSSLTRIVQGVVQRTRPDVVLLEASLRAIALDLESSHETQRLRVVLDTQIEPGTRDRATWDEAGEGDLAALQLTSGTTGFPKICVWKQANVIAALEGMAAAMRLDGRDICLNWTPLYHDMGLVNNFFLCLALGVPLGLMKPQDFVKDPSLWLRSLARIRATTTWSPNFGFALAAQKCREDDLRGVDLSHVRAFWNAAERIHYGTIMAFYERFMSHGVRLEALKTNFGCAENVGGATFSNADGMFVFEHVDRGAFLEERIARPVADRGAQRDTMVIVSAGRPHPSLRVHILSEDGRPLADGHIGEVALDSPSRMDGYLDDVQATDGALAGGLLRTGDLGYVRDAELFWVGRVQERINLRGVKLDPSDLEAALLGIRELRPGCFAAFGLDDAMRGTQKIVIVAEVRETASRSSTEISDDVRTGIFDLLGLNVDEVLLVREGTLTKTSSGKRRHRFFKALYEAGVLGEQMWSQSATAAAAAPERSRL